jgi:hypothetical protein
MSPSEYQKIISIEGDISVQNTDEYIGKFLYKGNNGISVKLVFNDGKIYAKPMQALPSGIVFDATTSLAPVTAFDMYQDVGTKDENLGDIYLPFDILYTKLTSSDMAIFAYVSSRDMSPENFEVLNKSLESKQSYYLVLLSNDEKAMQIISNNFPRLRTGLLGSVLDVEDYPHKTFFTFYETLDNINLKDASEKGIKVYTIFKKGGFVGADIDMKTVQGVLVDDTLSAYNNFRQREAADYYKAYLNLPFKVFGL